MSMTTYETPAWYNENDNRLADFLEALIEAGEIAPGVVDRRSIWDVNPSDLAGFTQHHFFAGAGIWSYALRQAGWPDDLPVWTGSCPCQPFSAGGKGLGFADERHLWPAWNHLIQIARPNVIFGEQVASKDGLAWLDLVRLDLDQADYAKGIFDLCAAGFGAPEIRQRLYFVADTYDAERRAAFTGRNFRNRPPTRWQESNGDSTSRRETNGFWSACAWRDRGDGRFVGLEPGMEPLAYVDPLTMVALHFAGNAIVAEQAIEFISAYMQYSPPEPKTLS